jgi:transcriptional regulator GlxA family with amidase domain
MKMAYVLFDGMTSLDYAGFYEALPWLRVLGAMEGLTWDLCADREVITDDRGMTLRIKHIRPDLSGYDLIFIPGGMSTRQLRFDETFVSWIRTAADVPYKVSVCTGALLLGAAGFLSGKKATTNPSAYDLLAPYCGEVVQARVVRDGNTFTGGGAATSIDVGLFVAETLTDAEVAKQVQRRMDYPYYQPGYGSDIYMPKAQGERP